MRIFCRLIIAVGIVAPSLFAGAFVLQIGSPAGNPEAQKNNGVLVARVTACRSPEKTAITATAEGRENGIRKSIPLKVIPLTTAGAFAITREWPEQGTWVVKLIATNPEYKDYAPSVLVPFEKNALQWTAAKHFVHIPADAEVAAVLKGMSDHARHAIN